MKKGKYLRFTLILTTLALLMGCVKEEPDAPPSTTIPYDPAKVYTISELKDLYDEAGEPVVIEDIFSVFCTVVMDERSGNIYKAAFVEDETGGIQLNYFYPGGLYLGDSIRVMLKGAKIENYNNLYQIQSLDVGENIYKLANNRFVEPETVTIPLLGNIMQYQSRVIRLENVQFAEGELGKTWADSVNLIDENRYLEDCSGNSIIVRTSGYANFAGHMLPEGNGSLIAIASVYSSTPQLVIRTESEVMMDGERCNPGGEQQLITIAELRALYAGNPVNITDSTKIKGVVISDVAAENLSGRNAFIMDEEGTGINLRFTDYHDYPLGEELEINVSGIILDEYNGLLQIQEIPLSRVKDLGPATVPPPLERTIQEILTDFESYESKLVRITNATIAGSGTWAGNNTLSDGTGEINLYTYDWATFANDPYPTYTIDITGIIAEYNSPQISIRNLDDVEESGGGGNPVTSLNQTFSSQTAGQEIAAGGWQNIAETGQRLWLGASLSGNLCAEAKSLGSGGENIIWLITPPINLDGMTNPVFEFESSKQFWLHDGLSVWISTDYDGSDPTVATWEELDCTVAGQMDPDNTWIPSGMISLSGYSGTGYVGFKYYGVDGAQSTPYRVDNVMLYDQ